MKHRLAVFPAFVFWAALCMGLCAPGPAGATQRGKPVPERIVSDSKDAPIEIPMSRREVVQRLGDFSRDFLKRRGTKAAEDVLRRLVEERRGRSQKGIGEPEEMLAYLSAPPDEGSCDGEGFMDAAAYALFLDEYGIEFHYIIDKEKTEADVLGSCDLAEVTAQLLKFPDKMLKFLGQAVTPKFVVYLHAEGLYPCGDAAGCEGDGIIYISHGKASITVHETAHAIEEIAIDADAPGNPLKGKKNEFKETFSIPQGWEWVNYDNYNDVKTEDLPPGITDQYALISKAENFAQACRMYVADPVKFIKKAHGQAWDEEIGLCLRYRFVYQNVFLYKDFTDLPAPQTAIVALKAVDKGDGDGRIEPGEYFSMDMSIVPLYDYSTVTHLRCLPWGAASKVVCAATSEFTNGLLKGKRYDFKEAFDFYLHPSFPGETNCQFVVKFYTPQGSLGTLGWDRVPLNEQGYLWGKNRDGAGGLVKFTSTMKEVEMIQWPASLLELFKEEGLDYHMIYDNSADCIWSTGDWAEGVLRIPRKDLGAYKMIPFDPDGLLFVDEISFMKQNPLDGALWVKTSSTQLVRLRALPDGVERLFLDIAELADAPFECVRDLAFDPANGKVWLISPSSAIRLSPSGEEFELQVGGLEGNTVVAPAQDGGCWIYSSVYGPGPSEGTLTKISASGEVKSTTMLDFSISAMVMHPLDGSLWACTYDEGTQSHGLVRVPKSGNSTFSWAVNLMALLIPCPADGSMFVNSWGDIPMRYKYPYTGARYTGLINLHTCFTIGYQPAF